MNGHVFPFARRGHDEAQRMLPWLANDTLDAEDRAWLEDHLATCEDCRRALREQRALQSACRAEAVEGDVEAGWHRIRSRLSTQAAVARPPLREPLRTRWQAAPRWVTAAMAAQAVLLAVLGFLLLRPPTPPQAYRTLGAAPAAGRVAGNLVIVFDPKIAEGTLRRLLAASNARIVDGPNEAGAYVLAVPPERRQSVREALRSAPGVVMVESLGDAP